MQKRTDAAADMLATAPVFSMGANCFLLRSRTAILREKILRYYRPAKRLSEPHKTRLFSPLLRNKGASFPHALGCLSAGVFMVTSTSVKRLMVSMSPAVVTHTISANGCVIAPATRLILSLLISPDGSIIPLSKSTFFMSSSLISGAALDAFLPPALTKRDYVEIRQDK